MFRLPPALAASATQRVLELLGPRPGRVLELGFAGMHAEQGRAGAVLAAPPGERFDAVVAPADADLSGIDARTAVLVGQDGSVWSSPSGTTFSPVKSSPT